MQSSEELPGELLFKIQVIPLFRSAIGQFIGSKAGKQSGVLATGRLRRVKNSREASIKACPGSQLSFINGIIIISQFLVCFITQNMNECFVGIGVGRSGSEVR